MKEFDFETYWNNISADGREVLELLALKLTHTLHASETWTGDWGGAVFWDYVYEIGKGRAQQKRFRDNIDRLTRVKFNTIKAVRKQGLSEQNTKIAFCYSAFLQKEISGVSFDEFLLGFYHYTNNHPSHLTFSGLDGVIESLREAKEKAQNTEGNGNKNDQLTLKLPPILKDNINYYGNQTIDVVGRETEQQVLRDFLKPDIERQFMWLQIAGVAGQGKSRLAFELVQEASNNQQWVAGLIDDYDIKTLIERLDHWQPNKPHLIVVDYVIGRTDILRLFFQQLCRRRHEFQHPVRLLLLERQPWNKNVIPHQRGRDISTPNGLSQARAEWFLNLTTRYDGNDVDIQHSSFQSGVLELTKLNAVFLTKIVRQVAIVIRDDDLVNSDLQIQRQLARIDKQGRPLFAYFLAQELAHGMNTEEWTRNDLLTATLIRERKKWWSIAFEGEVPSLEEDTLPSRLAVLATMTKTFNCKAAHEDDLIPKVKSKVRRQALTLTGGDTSEGLAGVSHIISALEPDLLGEWFVISSLDEGLPAEELTQIAWEHSPENMSSFMQRVSQDFGDQPTMKKMLKCCDFHQLDINTLSKVAHALFVSLIAEDADIPDRIIEGLQIEAKNGDPRSMSSLGWCFLNGVGVEKNVDTAYSWYLKAAESGNAGSLFNLGWFYQNDLSVEKNLNTAFECYKTAAEYGDIYAMHNLAWCYKHGAGTSENPNEAFHWFKKAARSGHLASMNALGLCFKNGFGTHENPAESFRWYEKASKAGSATAMNNLGLCYKNGNGTTQNLYKAFDCYSGAAITNNIIQKRDLDRYAKTTRTIFNEISNQAETNDVSVLFHLGWCYRHGKETTADINKAIELYEQAALIHNKQINEGYK